MNTLKNLAEYLATHLITNDVGISRCISAKSLQLWIEDGIDKFENHKQVEKVAQSNTTIEKQIAQAILDAQKMHEESYEEGNGKSTGEYKLEMEECFQIVCKKQGLSSNIWYLLLLANHWWNDVQWWAEDILAGRDITEDLITDDDVMEG